MKRFTLIAAMLLANISFTIADDQQDFNQQTEGWDWLFTEKSENKKVSYPVETYYRIFENHPDYRVRGRFIYDKNGELKRVAYLLAKTSTYYALAPFIGALFSIVMLGEPVTWLFMTASVIMAVGCWIAAK